MDRRAGDWPQGAIAADWRWNHFIPGPVGPPVAAGGLVYATRPDAHQVVALDVQSGKIRWTFTANGRVDTAATIHRGLCLFGCKSGWVYALRADDGGLVWRLRAAPVDERIVAYGQLESPWPVPGSVLVVDDVAYFAAGRQALADGGILVFAVEPATGGVRWVQRLGRVPQNDFYAGTALDFDNFDLLHREGDAVAMSRWLFDRASGKMICRERSGFARLATGGGAVFCPRGCWSYAAPNVDEKRKERPLAVFRRRRAVQLFAGPAHAVSPRLPPGRRRAVQCRMVREMAAGEPKARALAQPAALTRGDVDRALAASGQTAVGRRGDDAGRRCALHRQPAGFSADAGRQRRRDAQRVAGFSAGVGRPGRRPGARVPLHARRPRGVPRGMKPA